ncbi:MAG: DUF3833 domain-containing protein [Thiobacillus sp.]|uniref:DUF3833 domain-containing protein n=1 Tax=Thiobacillus sp. TaxID=924 RepID=UPI002732BBD3|nr:DUF3833 domain-containing protein [Thiobacillus sp.]MDP3419754.1 DUF3833 domain-containing protein [Thiobacillus sp.]MDP3583943.1 DUF3833 domain-containing protein [Thiobacillus sp.]
MLKKPLAILCTVLGLSGCAAVSPEVYRDQTPRLDLATYFNGPLTAWGYFADRSGEVKRRFTVRMTGEWQGNEGTLTEDFAWSDGTKSQRIWRITRIDAHRYVGRADDVKGTADGVAYGNALQWKYTLLLPVDGKTYEVQFDDWMYLMEDGVMLNKSEMRKFGFKLGEVVIAFRKGS